MGLLESLGGCQGWLQTQGWGTGSVRLPGGPGWPRQAEALDSLSCPSRCQSFLKRHDKSCVILQWSLDQENDIGDYGGYVTVSG